MKGILFQRDMIKAIADGRKTHTRRVIKLDYEFEWDIIDTGDLIKMAKSEVGDCVFLKPRYLVGETVYIKEAWRIESFMDGEPLLFGYKDGTTKEENELSDTFRYESWYERVCIQATEDARIAFNKGLVKQDAEGIYRWDIGNSPCRWHSPRFMPAWAARYFIKITSVNPQRLQEITEADIIAEGCDYRKVLTTKEGKDLHQGYVPDIWFYNTWNSINPNYPFESNPWAWDYGFELVSGA